MPNTEKSLVETPRMTNGLRGGSADSILQDVCIVQTNSSASRLDGSLDGLTAVEYRTLQEAYDYFNVSLFDGSLPQVLITLQRHHRALGYFSPKRFQSRGDIGRQIHEVALNPDGFTGNRDEDILSTLVHEMVHVWQQEEGQPGRGRYHNREWALKMYTIGLIPSTTGKPGGAVTGERVSHYILEGGRFAVACGAFLTRYRLAWESAGVRANDAVEDGSRVEGDSRGGSNGYNGPVKRANQTRTKFTCPNCGLNAWAKPDALVDCHDCSIEARETILMCANYSRMAESILTQMLMDFLLHTKAKEGGSDGSRNL